MDCFLVNECPVLSGEARMGPELEPKEKSVGRLEGLAAKENGDAPRISENKLMPCTSNYEDRKFPVEPFNNDQDGSKDVEVNIVDCATYGDVEPIEARFDDATESMSSFSDTISGLENGSIFSDGEVESQLCINDDAAYTFDGFDYPYQMSKKKLTDHWTRFIRPVASRCRWIEWHIKQLLHQAQKYDRKLAEIENRKHFANESFLVEGVEAKTLPFSCWERTGKAMKRRKRTKIEETVDVDSYMSKHFLFSYYEKKKFATDAAYVGEYFGNPEKMKNGNDEFGFQDDWAALQSKGDDNIHVIFRQIDTLQLQVRKLKNLIDRVLDENPGKFSSLRSLSLLATCDTLAGSEQSPSSPLEDGDKMHDIKPLCTQQLSKGDAGNLLPERRKVSTHEESNPISDIIGNSILPQVGVSCESKEEEILIHNHAAKEEIQSLNNFGGQLADNLLVSTEKIALQASEATSLTESVMARAQYGGKTLPKSRTNTSIGKRERRKRKSTGGRRRK